ncbi:hypothetical protein WN944_027295 [Citrus x changshan-huyou]|uniref:Uncharacterized protein n=1 Tax=Citrus x changshan-huyou TaxID=2935761 RepID=A0AAP0LNI3_9ROSI
MKIADNKQYLLSSSIGCCCLGRHRRMEGGVIDMWLAGRREA